MNKNYYKQDENTINKFEINNTNPLIGPHNIGMRCTRPKIQNVST